MPCVGRHVLVAGFQIPSAQRQLVQVGGQRLLIGRYPPQLLLHGEGVGALPPVVDVQVRLEGHRHLR